MTKLGIKLVKKHLQGASVLYSMPTSYLGLRRISEIPIPTENGSFFVPATPAQYQLLEQILLQSQTSSFAMPANIQKLIAKAHEGKFYSPGKGKYVDLGNNKYKHLCTSGPASFYKDALGIKLNGLWWNTGSPKTATKTNITQAGFTEKWSGDGQDVRNGNWKSTVRPGDIMVIFSSNSGHAQMWDGEKWISDTNQTNSWCYGKDKGRAGKRSAILYRNDSLWA